MFWTFKSSFGVDIFFAFIGLPTILPFGPPFPKLGYFFPKHTVTLTSQIKAHTMEQHTSKNFKQLFEREYQHLLLHKRHLVVKVLVYV